MSARSAALSALVILSALQPFRISAAYAAEDRIVLHDLITAAPLPAGYESKRQDFQTTDGLGNTLILVSKPGEKSRVQVTIDNKKLATKEEKVAAFKSAVNGIHGMFTKRGYKTIEMEHPDSKTLDPEKRLDLRLKMAKDGKVLAIDAEVFFTDHAFTAWAVTHSEAERDKLLAWVKTVRAK
jgi:hypothetical protein